jgi:copper chaperone CopZ
LFKKEYVMAVTNTYTVTGMTCSHCVHAVTEEISALAGVQDVKIDLPSGAVTVTSASPLEDDKVRAAVDEAGYEMANV